MKISANSICPCGSGKKYKKCCGIPGSKGPQTVSSASTAPNASLLDRRIAPSCPEYVPEEPDDEHDESLSDEEMLSVAKMSLLTRMQAFFVGRKEHVKKYKKLRKLHSEVKQSMTEYMDQGRFELKSTRLADSCEIQKSDKPIHGEITDACISLDTEIGAATHFEIHTTKLAPDVECLTEVFIKKNQFRKPDKVALLHAILNSRRSLFQVTGNEPMEAYVYLTDVFTGEEYTVVDIGMSLDVDKGAYIYRRLITMDGLCFGDSPSFPFRKDDRFIHKFIEKHKVNYSPDAELIRLLEIYNYYTTDKNRIRTTIRHMA